MSNFQVGLSWHQWIADPKNKKLFESNQAEAIKKFKYDEEDYIEQLIIQERIQQEIQLKEQQESVSALGLPSAIGVAGSAAGGPVAGSGGYSVGIGIGFFAIGTFLDGNLQHVDSLADEGFERFTIR